MIDEVYNIVNAISNKEQRGSITPEKFNLLANQAQSDIYNMYDLDRRINQANRGFSRQGLSDYAKMERERYQHFFTYDTMVYDGGDSTYYLPTNVNYIDSITYAGVELEECHSHRHFNTLKNSEDFQATEDFPIYLKTYNATEGTEILVYPETIVSALEIFYVRKINPCKWTYTVAGNAPLFNQSAIDYADFDLHASEKPNLVINICSMLGIKLRERDLAQYAELTKDKTVQQENTI